MNKIRHIIVVLFTTFAFFTSVNAASGSITASTGTKVATVGSTFKVTVKLNCSEALGAWDFGISYDSSNISLVSGDTHVVDSTKDGTSRSKTYTYVFKAIKSGTANIRITGAAMTGFDEMRTFTPSTSGTSVTVKTKAEVEASYSKDNNLKSLSVEGYEISPAFNKDTTEYSVSVPDTVTSIKINASPNDQTARVTNTGDIDISDGVNKIELVVTAQNGSTKTYTLIVNVQDLNPITVTNGGIDYTVVKKADLLTEPVGHTPVTITINGEEVPAFKSELTNFTIVGLKDADGKISLFIYDEETNTYTPYIELKGSSLILFPKELPEVLTGFTKTTLDINEIPCEVLTNDIDQTLIVIYALNIENGEEGYYIYDKNTNGFVTYTKSLFDKFIEENKELKLYFLASISGAGVLLLISIYLASKKAKLKRLLKKFSKIEENKDEIIENDDLTEETVSEEIVIQNRPKKKKKRK